MLFADHPSPACSPPLLRSSARFFLVKTGEKSIPNISSTPHQVPCHRFRKKRLGKTVKNIIIMTFTHANIPPLCGLFRSCSTILEHSVTVQTIGHAIGVKLAYQLTPISWWANKRTSSPGRRSFLLIVNKNKYVMQK
jgi:hypothetical protein